MNNTQTPDTMSDLEIYNAALARFDAQPIGRAKLYLQSTLDGFQRATDPVKYPASASTYADAQANLRDLFTYGESYDIREFAAWVEATLAIDTALSAQVHICGEVRKEAHHARKQAKA